MTNYERLVLKALVKGGGSSSEKYVYSILTASFDEDTPAVSKMWNYLDPGLKETVIDVLGITESFHLAVNEDIPSQLRGYMAKKAGRRDFFENTSSYDIDRMSDDDYDKAIHQNEIMRLTILEEKE